MVSKLIHICTFLFLTWAQAAGQNAYIADFGFRFFDSGRDIHVNPKGDITLLGQTENPNGQFEDFLLVKTNSHGQKIREKTFGQYSSDYPAAFAPVKNGGFILAGSSYSFDPNQLYEEMYAILIDKDWEVVWENHWGGPLVERFYDVTQTSDGGFAFIGTKGLLNPLRNSICILKVNNQGDSLWQRDISLDASSFGFTIVETSNGDLLVGGEMLTQNGPFYAYLAKINFSGDLLWESLENNYPSGSNFRKIVIDKNNNFYALENAGGSLNAIHRYSPDGDKIWTQTCERGLDMILDRDGNLVVSGEIANPSQLLVFKMDTSGNQLWQKIYNLPRAEGNAITQTPDGGYAICGRVQVDSTNMGGQMLLVKLSCDGELQDFDCYPPDVPAPPTEAFSIRVYPTHFQDELTVELTAPFSNREYHAELYDVQGRLIASKVPLQAGANSIPTASLAPGVYIYRLYEDKRLLETGKLLH